MSEMSSTQSKQFQPNANCKKWEYGNIKMRNQFVDRRMICIVEGRTMSMFEHSDAKCT